MKTFREIFAQKINEGADEYPGDEMTQKELKIAINAAKNILDMIEAGSPVQRWQISAIVKASEELASVCTSMRADEEENEEDAYGYGMNYEQVQIQESTTGEYAEHLVNQIHKSHGTTHDHPRWGETSVHTHETQKGNLTHFAGGRESGHFITKREGVQNAVRLGHSKEHAVSSIKKAEDSVIKSKPKIKVKMAGGDTRDAYDHGKHIVVDHGSSYQVVTKNKLKGSYMTKAD